MKTWDRILNLWHYSRPTNPFSNFNVDFVYPALNEREGNIFVTFRMSGIFIAIVLVNPLSYVVCLTREFISKIRENKGVGWQKILGHVQKLP